MSLCVCKGDVFLLLYQNSLDFAPCWIGHLVKLQEKKEIPEGISLVS